jgi:hypothetical protein
MLLRGDLTRTTDGHCVIVGRSRRVRGIMSDLDDRRAALARRILEMIDKHHGDVDKALSTLITDIDEEVLRLRSDVL